MSKKLVDPRVHALAEDRRNLAIVVVAGALCGVASSLVFHSRTVTIIGALVIGIATPSIRNRR